MSAVTTKMMQAARRAEYDYYQRGRSLGPGRFIPTPDDVIRAMLAAALATLDEPPVNPPKAGGRVGNIVTAYAPGKRPKVQ